jgi:hypothetical protein
MLFEAKKLEIDSAVDLFQCRISTVEPYVLMLSPVYVYMKRNEKFVSVKAPLDFFTPEELKSLSRYEVFFLPKAVSEVAPFQTAAKLVREMIKASQSAFPPPSYELSHEIMKVVSPIWGREFEMSPFCSAIFTDELCGPLNSAEIIEGRDNAVVKHDLGILLSGLLIFVLVHLGWHDLEILTSIRAEVYSRTIRGEEWITAKNEYESITRDLIGLVESKSNLGKIELERLNAEWAFCMLGRIRKISERRNVIDSLSVRTAVGGFSW